MPNHLEINGVRYVVDKMSGSRRMYLIRQKGATICPVATFTTKDDAVAFRLWLGAVEGQCHKLQFQLEEKLREIMTANDN